DRVCVGLEIRAHHGRVDHMSGAQVASRREDGLANFHRALTNRFLLDDDAALALDGRGNARAHGEVGVGGGGDGVNVPVGDVATLYRDAGLTDFDLHRRPCSLRRSLAFATCHDSSSSSCGTPSMTDRVRPVSPASRCFSASHCASACFGVSTEAPAKTWGCRLTILSFRRRSTSWIVNSPRSAAIWEWNTTWKSRSPSSSVRCSPPASIASRTSYASSMRYGLRDVGVCSRSHGHPPGPRSCAMIRRRCSKRGPEDSVMCLPDGQVIIRKDFRGRYEGR